MCGVAKFDRVCIYVCVCVFMADKVTHIVSATEGGLLIKVKDLII